MKIKGKSRTYVGVRILHLEFYRKKVGWTSFNFKLFLLRNFIAVLRSKSKSVLLF